MGGGHGGVEVAREKPARHGVPTRFTGLKHTRKFMEEAESTVEKFVAATHGEGTR